MSEFQKKLESMVDLFQEDFKQAVKDAVSKWRNGEKPVKHSGEYYSNTHDDGWCMSMIRDVATHQFNCNSVQLDREGKVVQAHIISVDPRVIPDVLDLFPVNMKLATLKAIENFKNGNREQKHVQRDDDTWVFEMGFGISIICATRWNEQGEIVSVRLLRWSKVETDEEFLNFMCAERYL